MSLKYLFPISKANMVNHITISSLLHEPTPSSFPSPISADQNEHYDWNLGAATHGIIVDFSDGTVSTPPCDVISTTEHAAAATTIHEESRSLTAEAPTVDTDMAQTLSILRQTYSLIGAQILEIETNIAERHRKNCSAPITWASRTSEAEVASNLSTDEWQNFYVSELLVGPSTTITIGLRK